MIKPGLTLHRLELFLAVLETGGIGRAARARHLSQPAVSEHLRGLGDYFGLALFERVGRGVRPTAAARQLEPYARQVVGLLRSARQAAEELRGLRSGVLAIGASTTPGTYLLPAVLGRFREAHPGVAVALRIGDTRQIEQWVAGGEIELGVIGEAPILPGLVTERWVMDELVVIVPRSHRLARRASVSPASLAGEPYITREEGSSTRGVAERHLARHGLSLGPAMELGSTEAIREAVAAGLGIAVVSRHALRPRDPRVVALRLAGRRWVRDLLLVRRAGAPLSPPVERLRELLRRAKRS